MRTDFTELLAYVSMPVAMALLLGLLIWGIRSVRRAPDDRRHPAQEVHRGPIALSLALLAVGLLFTIQISRAAHEQAYAEAQRRFIEEVDRMDAAMQATLQGLEYPLAVVRGILLTRSDVPRDGLQHLLHTGRQEGRFSGGQEVRFVERGAADPRWRDAAESAMRSGAPALVMPVRLPQDAQRPGMLYAMPVYAGGEVPATVAGRTRALRGWVTVSMLLAHFFAGEKLADFPMLNFQVFDRPERDSAGLLYDSAMPSGETTAQISLMRGLESQMTQLRPVLLADQVFYVQCNSSAAFETANARSDHLRIAFIGASLSVLGAMVLWLLLAGREHALRLAAGMTADLDRLALVARRTSSAVMFTDAHGRITWVNEGFLRISGYDREDVLGRRPADFLFSPQADAAVLAQWQLGVQVHAVLPCLRKDGQVFWTDLESQPIAGEAGQSQGVMTVQSDITGEVHAKAALVLEKERAANILSGTNVGTWETNLVTGASQWNDRWAEMLGFAPEEVAPDADRFWLERMHPDDRVRMNNAVEGCVSGQVDSYSCDVRARRKDGSWMWILRSAKVMSRRPDGRAEWMGGIHTDITEFKRVEQSLRDMEFFLDRAGQIAVLGAWQMDLKTGQIVFSDQTCEIHGVEAGYRPTFAQFMAFYPPDDRQRLQQAMDQGMAEGKSWNLELAFTNALGKPMWVRQFGEVEFDDSGAVRMVGAFQDVSVDKQARLEAQRSDALLRAAIDAINEAFVLYDPQDRLVFCNDKYRALNARVADVLAVGATFETILRAGAERGQYVDAEGRVDEWVQERLALHHGSDVAIEQPIADGRWLRVVERRMADGHTVGFRMDITELKMATAAAESVSAALAEERKRLQNILEGTNVGTWEWNVQTGENICNDRYRSMLGYSREEFGPAVYDQWARLVHPADLPQARRKMQAHLAGETAFYETEIRMRHIDGSWCWVLARGRLARYSEDGAPLWVYGTHMDITERKLAEKALAETSATLQNVLDSATHVGIISVGVDRIIRVFNKGAENLLGYDDSELVGRRTPSPFFDLNEIGALRESLELVLGRAPSIQDVFAHIVGIREQQEWTLVRKNGSRFIASLISSPICNAQGEVDGHLMIIYDISRQKEYETSLRQARVQAEQSSVAKSQFLANMSHEIRTPMNAILGMLQLLRNTALNVRQRDYSDKAEGAARSLLGLLNDILDFSKVEAGKMQLDPEPFLLEDLLGDLSVILSSNLGKKNVDLVFDVDPRIPHELVGDALRLRQILINLAGNAVKFTEQGEVVLRWILLAQTPERVRLAVEVQDTGIGIAEENQARIFEAFTQAESNTTRRFGGTGLGLVISTRLIRLMGGELKLRSEVGRGSVFSFVLEFPVVERELTAADAEHPLEAVRAPCRALLVDDNACARASAASLMRGLGWEVSEASSGEMALSMLTEQQAGTRQPDVVFIDWQMPGMDGWDTLRQARALYNGQSSPAFVLLSRHNREALVQRSEYEQSWLAGFLVKPVTAGMLAQALSQARQKSSMLTEPLVQATPPGRLQGMRLLLVEDNPINQQVAQELLSAEGALMTLADNGLLGLEALEAARPLVDAVLMDLQMPVMDGLSAARAIRQNRRYDGIPVIAMTANAMASDREACLEAGMNDHVGKPFDLNDLVSTLLKHTGWKVLPAAPSATPQPVHAPDLAAEDWPEGLDVALALGRMGGNQGLLARSIHAFVADARTLPQRLEQLIRNGNRAQAKRDLHALKGLSATLGATGLSALAAQAERCVGDPLQDAAYQSAVAALIAALEPTLRDLCVVAERLQAPPAQTTPVTLPVPDAQLQDQFRQLLVALQSGDMVAMELHAALRQCAGDSLAQALEPLDAAMAHLEFDNAAEECAKLVRLFDKPSS